ncbi:MAG TPA: hypothetical protein VII06_15940 [Chloroflexota bacterium]|jgi:hypothetical protein
MDEPITAVASPPAAPPLVAALLGLLLAHRVTFKQERPYQRCVALVFASLFAFARHTVTQFLTALGLGAADWSAWYRLFSAPRLDYEALSGQFLRETLAHIPVAAPFVAAVDGVQLPRHSRTMPGTGWLKAPRSPAWKPGLHRAQRYLHLAALLPRSAEGYSRALPLRWEAAFPEKAVPGRTPPRKEWEAALVAIRWLRAGLDAAGRRAQRLLVLGDGAYDVAALWAGLPGGVALLARCAKNRALYRLPGPQRRRGAPRKYGERAPAPPAWLAERAGWRGATVMVRGRAVALRFRVEGPFVVKGAANRPLFLLAVPGVARHRRRVRRDPSYYLVAAARDRTGWVLPLPAEELLAWAWQRWEVEVAHRELKAGFGLGEMQGWNPTATEVAAQWQAWAYGVLVLAGVRAWGLTASPIRPPGRWWRGAGRWSLGTLWRGYRQELWGTADFRPLYTGTGAEWAEKAAWLGGLQNAVAGSLRT